MKPPDIRKGKAGAAVPNAEGMGRVFLLGQWKW